MKQEEIEEPELKEPKEISVLIGEYIQKIFREWKPAVGETRQVIGVLYGFNLYIERENQNDEAMINVRRAMSGSNEIVFANKLYPQHPEGGLKYQFNNGIPSRDNAKLASRLFINALDRCPGIRIQYVNEKDLLVRDIEALSTVQSRPFGREEEIKSLIDASKKLEAEIVAKISGKAAVAEIAKVTDTEYEEVKPEEVGEYDHLF